MSQRVLNNLYRAETAIEHLVAMGVEVSHADLSAARPKIWLRGKDQELRGRFRAAYNVMKPIAGGGRETIMAAPYLGCQLQWEVRQ